MRNATLLAILVLIAAASASAQIGTIKTEEFYFASLEGNLVGDPPKRSVIVYLPPGYEKQRKMRYPVVYLLHGYGANIEGNKGWVRDGGAFNVEAINRLITEKKIAPMIIVMPDGGNRFGGSMYVNSITTGNWEDYIVRELVALIDKSYRTLARVESRGIAGHSMGGYGAVRIAMKHPDVFGAVFGSSPCCMTYVPTDAKLQSRIASAKLTSFEEADKAPIMVRVSFAYAAAWSPNPANPPFFSDYPIGEIGKEDERSASVMARWYANIPTYMIDQYAANLRRLRGIAISAGTQEMPIQNANREFSEALKRNKIEHIFKIFEGGHVDKVRERIETDILPFFSRTLVSQKSAATSSNPSK